MLGNKQVAPWNLAAKIDETAGFLCAPKRGAIDLPPTFGRARWLARLVRKGLQWSAPPLSRLLLESCIRKGDCPQGCGGEGCSRARRS